MFRKILYSLITFLFCFLPIEIFIGLWFLIHPIFFWQKFLVILLGFVFLGAIQFWLIIAWLAVLVAIFKKDALTPNYVLKNRIEKY